MGSVGGRCDDTVGIVSAKEVTAVPHLMRVQNSTYCCQQSEQEHKFIHRQLICVQLEQVVKICSSEAVPFLQEITQVQ